MALDEVPELIYTCAAYEGDPWPQSYGHALAGNPAFRAVVAFVYRAAWADGRQAGAVDQARAVAAAIEDERAEYLRSVRDAAQIGAGAPLPKPVTAYADGLRRAAEVARGGR